ncbi:unnamed protein product [Urochloa decumbens]|uniref:Uncharacterized protein n=1 Tax=Urochloa decumbens TaxID=240449 RepID=A0ABC9AI70_9POAL
MEREGSNADAPRPPPRPPPSSSSPPATGSEARKLRDRVSFTSRPRPSCWGRIRVHRIGRSRGRTGGSEGRDTAPAVPVMRTATTIPSRLCGVGEDRGPGGCGGKADAASAAGARSLLQRNDFYCDDCNTHRSWAESYGGDRGGRRSARWWRAAPP